MPDAEWERFLNYVENSVRAECQPQRESLQGGPFEWMQTLSGSTFGNKVGSLVVRFFLEDEMLPRRNAGHDLVFRERRVELKTGVEHSTPGVFLFQQIRPQQDWDALLCLGVGCRHLVFFVLSKQFVRDAVQAWRDTGQSVISPQHGGAQGRRRSRTEPDTFWIWTKPEFDGVLASHRSRFDCSGWQGPTLREGLAAT
jgi:hypothetical protein